MRTIKYSEALSEGLVQSMERDESIFVTGIAVDHSSGIFGSTSEAARRFGPDRLFDAPSMENALTGIAIGAAAMGKRPVVVHMRNDFLFLALDQIINVAAKWKYMFGGNAGTVPIVVRAVVGKGWGQGATHSQCLHSVIGHFPGINVVLPATPKDAKGLTAAALQADSPTVILEHRSLFGTEGEVPEEYFTVPIGKANVVLEGFDVTIAAVSAMVPEAMVAASTLEREGISVELVDARSIRPFDGATIINSVKKTGRLIVADTSWELCGFSAEVAAVIAENCHDSLKAAVKRIALADCPAPVSLPLEDAFYPKASTIVRAALALMGREESADFGHIDPKDTFKGPY